MDQPITDQLKGELARWRLLFCCEDCLHHCEARQACDLLYPEEPHRRASFERGERLVFCKMFEVR
ncbi:MAG: hypothetical protein IT383_14030 [Deltaproteobacteria bacterium]|nr:hypothetical protein [Deltaproteobacteria bacterium]